MNFQVPVELLNQVIFPDGFVPDGFVPDGFVPDGFVPDGFGAVKKINGQISLEVDLNEENLTNDIFHDAGHSDY